VLNKLPKSVQPKAKKDLRNIWMADSREDAEEAFDTFLTKYATKYDKATACLKKDRKALLTFYDSLLSTGNTSGPQNPLKALSRPYATAQSAPKAAYPAKRDA
jgi:transposase-like protein